MSVHHLDGSATEMRKLFLAKLAEAQAWFHARGIEYRILGSIASSSYLEDADNCSLDFNRPGARLVHQRMPDVDLLIARADLLVVQEYRDRLANNTEFSINLEIHPAACHIDFRPAEPTSFLTHRELRVPVPTSLFHSVERDFLGQGIVTLDVGTLFHTFVANGGVMRDKDRAKARALAELIHSTSLSVHSEDEYRQFHHFIRERARRYRGYIFIKWAAPKVRDLLPSKAEYLAVQIAKYLEPRLFGSH